MCSRSITFPSSLPDILFAPGAGREIIALITADVAYEGPDILNLWCGEWQCEGITKVTVTDPMVPNMRINLVKTLTERQVTALKSQAVVFAEDPVVAGDY